MSKSIIKELLKKSIETKSNKLAENTLEQDPVYFEQIFKKITIEKNGHANTTNRIPKFYWKIAKFDDDQLQQKLREESRALFLQNKSHSLLDNQELKELWQILDENSTQCSGASEQMITYDDYLKIKNLASPKCQNLFDATLFYRLQQDDINGRISIMALFNYIMRRTWVLQTRIGLSLYDVTGQGHLRECDMENYISELIPTLGQLNLEESFVSFYVCTAVRKFFFFLDPMRTGRIRIQDILASSFLDQLLELREVEEKVGDDEIECSSSSSNWFSAKNALRVYGDYLNLDKDHNGMLSKQELTTYGSGTLTSTFLDRVFEECLTYDGEMDYKTYLDFVLALENRNEPQSLIYFFRIFDIRHQGYLDPFDINFFFRGIEEQMLCRREWCEEQGVEVVSFDDVKDEIFDMIKPINPNQISLNDLIKSGYGETFVNILIEFQGFLSYENREMMITSSSSSAASISTPQNTTSNQLFSSACQQQQQSTSTSSYYS